MWEMAAWGKGFHLDLQKVPDGILDDFLEWKKERVEAENEAMRPPGT